MIPQLRFPEFTDEWQVKKLGDIAKKVGDRNGESFAEVVLTNSAVRGVIPQSDYFDKDIAVQGNLANYYKAAKDDFVYNPRISVSAPVGPFKRNHFGDGVMSPLYNLYRFKSGEVLGYLEQYLSTTFWHKYMKGVANYGARSDRMAISSDDLLKIPFPYPKKPEQQKIADFLGAIDDKLTSAQNKVAAMREYKKGVMQALFSGKLRFKDENGNPYPDWEEKKLGDLLDYEQPTKYIVNSTDYDDRHHTPVLTAGKTFILGYTDEADGIFENNLPVIIFDDFTTASHLVDFPFKVKSSAMKILKAKSGVNIKVAYELLNQIRFSAEDHKRYWIGTYQDFTVKLPSPKEQKKITDFISAIDEKIKLEEAKLASSKEFKKALLQRMFV